ncbi:MAG: hypothetical protein ACO1OO_00020 [Flavisolibacter sp.]
MATQLNICESCRIRPVEIVDHPDAGQQPYRLCTECHKRLLNYALRPLEFFNLATIHGHGYYLNDDLYDYNTGEATQPKTEVEIPEKFPFPDIHSIQDEMEKVVDYACVQYFTSNEVIELLKRFDKDAVLDFVSNKVAYNRAINYKAYQIAASVLGPYAADWIRLQWSERNEDELFIFAPALAACLPFPEAFKIVTEQVEQSDSRSFADYAGALLYFESSETLKWIEGVAHRIANVSENWGILAAASRYDWQTAQNWLAAGRPLSLIALDALIYCTTTGERPNQALWLREHPPTLVSAPKPETIANTLTAYLQTDTVPRTKSAVRQIINNLFETDLE